MRSRRSAQDELAEVARRRLELLSEELAAIRGARPVPEAPDGSRDGSWGGSQDGSQDGPQGGRGGPRAAVHTDAASAQERRAGDDVPGEPLRPGRHARRPLGRARRAGGWVHDQLPPTLQGRVQLGAGHLAVVALLVAFALAVTAWWVVRANGSSTAVPAASWREEDTQPAALVTPAVDPVAQPAGEGGTAAPAEVVVDVAGKVRRPGIVVLPTGSRVVDALENAGGARRGVDLTTLNLARVLVDGEQIVVGIPPPPGVAAPAASAPGAGAAGGTTLMVNLNSATQAELEELPGIGPVTAAAILAWRTDHGAFTAVDELMEVSGIGEATLAEVAPFVTL